MLCCGPPLKPFPLVISVLTSTARVSAPQGSAGFGGDDCAECATGFYGRRLIALSAECATGLLTRTHAWKGRAERPCGREAV
eukprot:3545827-Pleurochrysis_carterae.AAC.2